MRSSVDIALAELAARQHGTIGTARRPISPRLRATWLHSAARSGVKLQRDVIGGQVLVHPASIETTRLCWISGRVQNGGGDFILGWYRASDGPRSCPARPGSGGFSRHGLIRGPRRPSRAGIAARDETSRSSARVKHPSIFGRLPERRFWVQRGAPLSHNGRYSGAHRFPRSAASPRTPDKAYCGPPRCTPSAAATLGCTGTWISPRMSSGRAGLKGSLTSRISSIRCISMAKTSPLG